MARSASRTATASPTRSTCGTRSRNCVVQPVFGQAVGADDHRVGGHRVELDRQRVDELHLVVADARPSRCWGATACRPGRRGGARPSSSRRRGAWAWAAVVTTVTSSPIVARSSPSPIASMWPTASRITTRSPRHRGRAARRRGRSRSPAPRPGRASGATSSTRTWWPAAGGDDDRVGLEREHGVGGGLGADPHVDAAALALGDAPVGEVGHLLAAGERLGEADLAAELGRPFEEGDLVAAGGRDPRRLEAAGPAADDDDALGLGRGGRACPRRACPRGRPPGSSRT